jgi:hypothetical protein
MMIRFPCCTCVSEQAVPRPADWPDHSYLTGYWFLDRPEGWLPLPGLSEFLDAKPEPIQLAMAALADAIATPKPDGALEISSLSCNIAFVFG